MSAPVFVDADVLVHADDTSDPIKHECAGEWLEALWSRRLGRVSTQVLNDYYVTVTRQLARGLKQGDARAKVRRYQLWRPVQIDHPTVETAWGIEARAGLDYRDALLVASAQQAGCATLLTEHLPHGQKIGLVTIVDPFRTAPSEVLTSDA